jgi:glycosyltransferase involved in cell wall biosynthesis
MADSSNIKIGVIISTYNNPKWLEKVLWGYSHQSHSAFELIVADDGSGIETKELIERFQLESTYSLKHIWQEDRGFQKCKILNKALLASESDYLIFTDQDCIPRYDFIEKHLQLAEKGYFLSGGYFKLPMDLSLRISHDDIKDKVAFQLQWLRDKGLKISFKCTKLWTNPLWSRFMNFITPTAASWNGCNSSGWKSDMLLINGFNEDMQYGGQDREFGERLWNLGLKSKQIRYSAICLHLDHMRPYKTEETLQKNKEIRKETRRSKQVETRNGIRKLNGSSI